MLSEHIYLGLASSPGNNSSHPAISISHKNGQPRAISIRPDTGARFPITSFRDENRQFKRCLWPGTHAEMTSISNLHKGLLSHHAKFCHVAKSQTTANQVLTPYVPSRKKSLANEKMQPWSSLPIISRTLWWLEMMTQGPSTWKFSNPFTWKRSPKKYFRERTKARIILGKEQIEGV